MAPICFTLLPGEGDDLRSTRCVVAKNEFGFKRLENEDGETGFLVEVNVIDRVVDKHFDFVATAFANQTIPDVVQHLVRELGPRVLGESSDADAVALHALQRKGGVIVLAQIPEEQFHVRTDAIGYFASTSAIRSLARPSP